MAKSAARNGRQEKTRVNGVRSASAGFSTRGLIMAQIIKKVRVWWMNVQIGITKAEMCAFFERGDLMRARDAMNRFYTLIDKRNALDVQP